MTPDHDLVGVSSRSRRAGAGGALLLVLVICGAAPAQAQTVTKPMQKRAALHLASTPWSPFTNESGKPRFAIDLVHAALERLGISEETTIVAEGTLSPALLEGKFDGSPAVWRTTEREESLVYSKPYLENRLVLVARKGYDVSAPRLAALDGQRIALVDGFAYGDELEPKGAKGPVYVSSSTVEESVEKVLAGDAEYALLDELVVQYLLTNYAEQAKARLAIGSEPLVFRSLHFAVRRKVPGAQSIVDRFDAEVTKMIADHTYHQLLRLGWIEADVDGDGRMEVVPASDAAGDAPPARRYELVTVTGSKPEPDSKARFFLGGSVYEGWTNVPDRYQVIAKDKTAWGSQVAPVFSIKW
jgi:polar amino acid transport system substrate-binding protein